MIYPNDKDEYGPWIEHDGLGCPCVGAYVHCVHDYGVYQKERWAIAGSEGGMSWDWSYLPKHTRIIRYRIRKPRGMYVLQEILLELEDNPKIMEPV